MELGRALRYLIRVELARREGDDPQGRDAELASMIEAAFNASGPPLTLGVDCDGDAFPDGDVVVEQVIDKACECRLTPDEPERELPPQPSETIRSGSRGW